MAIHVSSDAFQSDRPIPQRHARQGENLSPPLMWEDVPEEAQQLALVVDDPDAPSSEPWVHWVIYNIPPDVKGLPEGVEPAETPAEPTKTAQGRNSWDQVGYGGPQPPAADGPHHYHFRLFALDVAPDLPPGLTRQGLMDKAAGHIKDEGELIGTYQTDQ